MLNDQLVTINIDKRQAIYYNNLGYDIKGSIINVSDADLPRYSTYKVLLKCDWCNETFQDNFYNYANRQHKMNSDQKDKCSNCYAAHNETIIPYGYAEPIKGTMKPWRIDSLKHFNYRCEITGVETNTVHHKHDFMNC
jgi:hypothetical protein